MVSKLCDRYFFFFFFLAGLWSTFLIVVLLEAGAGGGLVASIATCPLDVIKTKLQAQRAVQGQQAYLGVFGVFAHLYPFYSQNIPFNSIAFFYND